MKTVFLIFSVFMVILTLIAGCSDPFAGDTLVALPVTGQPTEADWKRAVPLDLTVWMGNVNIPQGIVALDMETSHRSTAECHHGPSTSDPVDVRIQALYNQEELYMLFKWPDKTQDRDLGTWEPGPEGWTARPGADDGIALLWEPVEDPADETAGDRQAGDPFRCQYACHMMEVDVYDGGTKMRMGMKAPEGKVLDLWRWRASVTDPFGRADDMVVDAKGKRGDEGQVLPMENRKAYAAGPGNSGQGGEENDSAPYYIVEAPYGRQGHIRAESRWEDGVWHLLLTRELDTADPDDVIYTPGARIPFSVSVFDNTFSEHHVLADSAVLILWQRKASKSTRRESDEPMDF